MSKEVRIYLEGGGDSSNGRSLLRNGFDAFLSIVKNEARKRRMRWSTIACGSRQDAYRNFLHALEDHPEALNLLVVDSEAPVKQAPDQHLISRDGWNALKDVDADRCHLMVQVMESWLITDKAAVKQYYGQGFRPNQIPDTKNVEKLTKRRVDSAIKNASSKTKKGKYHKIKHASALLGRVDPQKVRKVASHCDRFLNHLEDYIGM